MSIDQLVNLPARNQAASTFVTNADAIWPQLNTFATQANAMAAEITSVAAGSADAIPYTFSTTITDSDPGNGILRLNTTTQNVATIVRADLLGSDGSTWTNVLDTFDDSTSTIKGRIFLVKLGDSTKWLSFDITALASPSGYRNITVTPVASSTASPFADGDGIVLKFSRTGDKGTIGNDSFSTVTATATNLTLVADDLGKLIKVTATGATVTLPAIATAVIGKIATVSAEYTSGTTVVDANGAELIANRFGVTATTYTLNAGETAQFVSNGTTWDLYGYSATIGVTPSQFDNSTKLATTAFIKTSGLRSSGFTNVTTSSVGEISVSSAGGTVLLNSATAISPPLPALSSFIVGTRMQFMNINAGNAILVCDGSDLIKVNASTVSSILLTPGETLTLESAGSSVWYAVGGTSLLRYANIFSSGVGRQLLVNGGAEVAQRTAPSLSTTPLLGAVDRCFLWASAGAVSAGTITQSTTASIGRTAKAIRVQNATLTGSAVIAWRYRMEAADAVKLLNQQGSFQIMVRHDVGSAINYTIIIRKPTAADNFTSTTVIDTGSAISVASGVSTMVSTPIGGISLGDCSNGLEIEVQAACGAVTTKNFYYTEWQLEEGPVITPFERRSYQRELAACQRDYETGSITRFAIASGAGIEDRTSIQFKVTKRTIPTIVFSGGSDLNLALNTAQNPTVDHFDHRITSAAAGQFSTDGLNFTASTGT